MPQHSLLRLFFGPREMIRALATDSAMHAHGNLKGDGETRRADAVGGLVGPAADDVALRRGRWVSLLLLRWVLPIAWNTSGASGNCGEVAWRFSQTLIARLAGGFDLWLHAFRRSGMLVHRLAHPVGQGLLGKGLADGFGSQTALKAARTMQFGMRRRAPTECPRLRGSLANGNRRTAMWCGQVLAAATIPRPDTAQLSSWWRWAGRAARPGLAGDAPKSGIVEAMPWRSVLCLHWREPKPRCRRLGARVCEAKAAAIGTTRSIQVAVGIRLRQGDTVHVPLAQDTEALGSRCVQRERIQ